MYMFNRDVWLTTGHNKLTQEQSKAARDGSPTLIGLFTLEDVWFNVVPECSSGCHLDVV